MGKVVLRLSARRWELINLVRILSCFHSFFHLLPNIYTVGSQIASFSISGVSVMLRKVAVAAASKPHVEIRQNGEHFYIKTSTTVRTTEVSFNIGEEFNEETVDGRKVKVRE